MVYRTKGDCWSLVVTTMILPAAGLVCLVQVAGSRAAGNFRQPTYDL